MLGSTLSVMAGAAITPALPEMSAFFSEVPNVEFLTKLMLSIPPLFIALFSPVAGYLFERYGRKPVLIVSAVIYGISGTSGFYLDNIYLILIGRALMGVSIAGLMTGFIVVVGDLFKGDKMSKFIGIQGAVMSLGGVVYLLLGGLLADIRWNIPFLIYSIAFFVALGLFFLLDETRSVSKGMKMEKVKFSRETLIVNATAMLVMIFYLMVPTQLPFLMRLNFPEFSPSKIGMFIAIWIFFSSLASITYSKLRRRLNFNAVYILGFAIWAFAHLLLFFSANLALFTFALILAGVGNGLVVPNLKAHILDKATAEQRGRHSGFLTMSLYIGQFLSPILVQPLLYWMDIKTVFVMFGFVIAAMALGFAGMRGKIE